MQTTLNIIAILLVVVIGFALAAICAYFAGLVGSSANPLSSMALIALIISSFIISLLVHNVITLASHNIHTISVAAIAVIITAISACIASISNDTMQDLKAGFMVGATPWKQQTMLMIGVCVSALVIPLILQLLFDAYGLTNILPHPNMDPTQALMAPQAGLMAAVVQGIFTHHSQWDMMFIGATIAVISLIIDARIKQRGWRLPVLAVGIGIYLPIETTMALVIGSVLSYFVEKSITKQYGHDQKLYLHHYQRSLLLASGLVAGSAIMGVILAIPFVIVGSADALRLVSAKYATITQIAGLIITVLLCIWFKFRITGIRQKGNN